MMKLLQAKEHTVMIRVEPITWMDEGNGGDEESIL